MTTHEVHAELLMGRKVRDRAGHVIGRIEEIHLEVHGGEHVVTEYHLGAAALLERLAVSARQLPLLRLLPAKERVAIRVSWRDMDLSDPARPRLAVER